MKEKMKLAIIKLPDDWERGKCEHCIFSESEHCECILKMSPSSNHGCGLIVDEGVREDGPLTRYSRNIIAERLQQHEEDQSRIANHLGRVLKRDV